MKTMADKITRLNDSVCDFSDWYRSSCLSCNCCLEIQQQTEENQSDEVMKLLIAEVIPLVFVLRPNLLLILPSEWHIGLHMEHLWPQQADIGKRSKTCILVLTCVWMVD